MSYGLLWIEVLVISLLWIATAAALVARVRVTWLRGLTVTIAVLIPLACMGTAVFFAGALKFGMGFAENWFYYTASLFVCFAVGTLFILVSARRRAQPDGSRAAANWSRGLLALSFGAAVALGWMTLWNMDLALRQEAAATEGKAGAMFATLVPPVVPDSENAAIAYEAAASRISQDAMLTGPNSPLGDDTVDIGSDSIAAVLKRHEKTLSLLRAGAALTNCRFDRDWSRPDFHVMLPELNGMRSSALLLQLHARSELSKGRVDSALSDIDAMFALAAHIGQEPVLISALVSRGIYDLSVKTYEEAVSMVTNPAQLHLVHLPEPDAITRIAARGLRGEECFQLDLYGQVASGAMGVQMLSTPFRQSPYESGSNGNLVEPLDTLFRLFFFSGPTDDLSRLMDGYRVLASKPYFQIAPDLKSLSAESDDLKLRTRVAYSWLVPSFNRSVESFASAEAEIECAQTAEAMTKYRLDHGQHPSHLQDLVPAYLDEVPLDNFDGQPLRLAIRDHKWIIYSIGLDMKDDGGTPYVERKDKTSTTGYDLTFTLRAASAPAGTTQPANSTK